MFFRKNVSNVFVGQSLYLFEVLGRPRVHSTVIELRLDAAALIRTLSIPSVLCAVLAFSPSCICLFCLTLRTLLFLYCPFSFARQCLASSSAVGYFFLISFCFLLVCLTFLLHFCPLRVPIVLASFFSLIVSFHSYCASSDSLLTSSLPDCSLFSPFSHFVLFDAT